MVLSVGLWETIRKTQTQTQMDILIVFCTASFIATYAILVYRALPQE